MATWGDANELRSIVKSILAEVQAIDPNLGDAAVERLGFEIVGFLTVQADVTRGRIGKRLADLCRKRLSESDGDFDEPMYRAFGIGEATDAIDEMSDEDLGIPLGVFRKR